MKDIIQKKGAIHPRLAYKRLLSNIQYLYQCGEIDESKKNELTVAIMDSFKNGYGKLNEELLRLRYLIVMVNVVDECLELTKE